MNLKDLIAKATSGNTLERTAARLNLADALVENAPAIAELIEAAQKHKASFAAGDNDGLFAARDQLHAAVKALGMLK